MAAEKNTRDAEEIEGTGGDEEPKKKGKLVSLLIIGAVVLAVSAGGYFAYTMYIGPKFFHKEDKAAAKESPKKETTEKLGAVVSLEPFVVNLMDEKGMRYLKMKMDLELDSPEEQAKAEVEKHVPQLRDSIIMLLTSKSWGEVMTLEGKIKMRDEIVTRSNQFLGKYKVKTAYFTEFVVQ